MATEKSNEEWEEEVRELRKAIKKENKKIKEIIKEREEITKEILEKQRELEETAEENRETTKKIIEEKTRRLQLYMEFEVEKRVKEKMRWINLQFSLGRLLISDWTIITFFLFCYFQQWIPKVWLYPFILFYCVLINDLRFYAHTRVGVFFHRFFYNCDDAIYLF